MTSRFTLIALLAAAIVPTAALKGRAASEGRGVSLAAVERNKTVARRWSEELWGRGTLAVADEIIAADYVRHDPGDPFPAHGPAEVKKIVTMLRGMLPDLQIEIDAMVAEDDMVVTRYTSTATDSRGYMGRPPTGRTIRTTAMQMFRFRDGKIVESWAVRDDLSVLRQLGHLPAPSAR